MKLYLVNGDYSTEELEYIKNRMARTILHERKDKGNQKLDALYDRFLNDLICDLRLRCASN